MQQDLPPSEGAYCRGCRWLMGASHDGAHQYYLDDRISDEDNPNVNLLQLDTTIQMDL
jgi:hypothetical protein